ncbi:MAG: peptidoglycan bridge formation glycyltransferase FemA/FemB family protein [Chloroflexi bacterium]|nr:peptidoglycan bridge formation glycyltransferase FemA/FemB family protein [Chloroflexota bacterium]
MSNLDAVSVTPERWDQFVQSHVNAHILQTSLWGDLKARFGWEVERIGLSAHGSLVAGAQILYRRLPAGIGRLAYIPRGPLVDWQAPSQTRATLEAVERAARARGAIAITFEPELCDNPAHSKLLQGLGFRSAPLTVQPRRTLIVDITPDEDTILAGMKSKTRYNVRLAARKGVTVRTAEAADLATFNALMATTGERDAFGVHTPEYYQLAYELFVPRGWARLLLAEIEGEAVAAVMIFAIRDRSWYFYGASGDAHREKMPTYLLQWEGMRWARSLGCTSYDLWGVPDADEATLEGEFSGRSDGLWGVYRFKRGFGGTLVRTVGAWDHVCSPLRYGLYRALMAARRQARPA